MNDKINIKEFNIRGKTICMDFEEDTVYFPEDCTKEQIEWLSCYLKDEGFLEAEIKDLD